ncbi:DUF6708 domain-containing protein, partial [Escherichia coli]
SFVFAAILNYFIFAPRHYPIRFNRKTGKVYICNYILNDMSHKQYSEWWRMWNGDFAQKKLYLEFVPSRTLYIQA